MEKLKSRIAVFNPQNWTHGWQNFKSSRAEKSSVENEGVDYYAIFSGVNYVQTWILKVVTRWVVVQVKIR